MPQSSETCERHLEAGRRALSLGDLTAAESELRAAVAGAEAGEAGADVLTAALASLAQLLYQTRRFAEAAPVFARTLELREAAAGAADPSMVPALHNLAAVHVAAGNATAAEPLLRRALAILEQLHGPEHPELSGVLNALSQLCLRRGAYADAEPLLKRLLTIRRAEGGEERPEVATVMASLATVHHALAEHDAAERLLRRVLEIRERTLAPNHFAIATSLEALAETCATRGKLAEALGLLERALDIRERTLEPAHPSLAVVRSKIADLQLQLSSDAFAVPLMEAIADHRPPPAPVPAPLPHVRASPPTLTAGAVAAPAHAPALTEFRAPPTGIAAGVDAGSRGSDVMDSMRLLAAELAGEVAPATADRGEQSNLSVAFLPTGSALVLPGERSALTRAAFDDASDDEMDFDASTADERTNATLLGRPSTRIALLGVALLTLATTGALVARGVGGDGDGEFVQSSPGGPQAPARSMAAGAIALPDAGGSQAPATADSASTQPAQPAPAASSRDRSDAPTARSSTSAPANRSAGTTEQTASAQPPGPVTPAPIAEQLVRGVDVRIDPSTPSLTVDPTATQREAGLAIGALGANRSVSGYALQPTLRPAAPVGTIPQPRYPADLQRAGVAGDVVVSFIVNTDGRVDASSLRVVRATDARFVGPVTDILPRLRFMPADSAGTRVRQRVEMPFRFNP